MTKVEDLEKQLLKEDIEPYNAKVYDGFLPETLVDQFRVAIMMLPLTQLPYSLDEIEVLSGRRHDEVTNKELGMILNVIAGVAFASMYSSLEEAIEKSRVIMKIRDEYNKSSGAFQRKVDAKMKRLLSLSGVTNSTSMKIIPGNQ